MDRVEVLVDVSQLAAPKPTLAAPTPSAMANEGAKKRIVKNAAFMRLHLLIVLVTNALCLLYRVGYLWDTFSGWHWAGLGFSSFVYLVTYYLLRESAKPHYAPLNDGGALVSGGEDMDAQGGVIEYTRDMLYVTAFVQVMTSFVSDWWWLLHLVPPSIGFYFLWTKVVYPWISKPDPEPQATDAQGKQKTKIKYGKAR